MGETRIARRFADARQRGRTALIAYVMAGDPDAETSLATMQAIRDAGADLIEVGIPFTDPMADGPVIQAAAARALAGGMTLTRVLDLIARFRAADDATPIIGMGYANPIARFGFDAFAAAADRAGMDGVVCVDLPPEEDSDLRRALAPVSMATIRLATPTSDDARMRTICDGAGGFIYYVSVAGVTGAGTGDLADVRDGVARARAIGDLPVAVGFGVREPERARALAQFCDAVVIGSGLIVEMERAGPDRGRLLEAVGRYIAGFDEVL